MYVRQIAMLALIAAACADAKATLERASQIKPDQAQDPAGQDDANGEAAAIRTAAETRVRGILDDIKAHANEALTVSWQDDPIGTNTPPPPPAEPVPGAPVPGAIDTAPVVADPPPPVVDPPPVVETPAPPSDTVPPSDPVA